jgi:hypothetical protein
LNLLGLSIHKQRLKTVGLMGIGVFRFSNVFSTASANTSPLKTNVGDNIQMSQNSFIRLFKILSFTMTGRISRKKLLPAR